MKQHLDQLRFIFAEWLLYKAWRILPDGIEKRELAIFFHASWIGRMAGNPGTYHNPVGPPPEMSEMQKAWKAKIGS